MAVIKKGREDSSVSPQNDEAEPRNNEAEPQNDEPFSMTQYGGYHFAKSASVLSPMATLPPGKYSDQR